MAFKVDIDLNQAIAKSKRRPETFLQEFTQDLAEEALRRTPVDTGFLRGSWFVSLNDKTTGAKPTADKSGANTMARIAVNSQQIKPGDVIYFLNQAGYAAHVEFGTQYMAPRAFVRGTASAASAIAHATANRIAP